MNNIDPRREILLKWLFSTCLKLSPRLISISSHLLNIRGRRKEIQKDGLVLDLIHKDWSQTAAPSGPGGPEGPGKPRDP